jgi:prepilin-type N-terminal cleavage/methylation domain-containing protein
VLKRGQKGFTIIETVIVIAIIAILTTVVLQGGTRGNANQQFTTNLREFINVIREAQTKSYSTQTGTSSGCTNAQGTVISPCFWRGNVLEFDTTSDSYSLSLLYGDDLSQFAQTSASSACATTSQQLCLEGKQLIHRYNLTAGQVGQEALVISSIAMAGISPNPTKASIAFLSPDGRAYTANTIYASANFNPATQMYSGSGVVTLTIKDAAAANVTGTVTFDPNNGIATWSVQ